MNRKNLKNVDTDKVAVVMLNSVVLPLSNVSKVADGMASSADPDQTAPACP